MTKEEILDKLKKYKDAYLALSNQVKTLTEENDKLKADFEDYKKKAESEDASFREDLEEIVKILEESNELLKEEVQ